MQAWAPRCRPSNSCLPYVRIVRGVEQWRERHDVKIRRVGRDRDHIGDFWKVFQSSQNGRKSRLTPKTKAKTSWAAVGKQVKEDAFDREGLGIIDAAFDKITLDEISFDDNGKPRPEDLERYRKNLNSAFSLPSWQRTRETKLLYTSLREIYIGRGLQAVTQALQDEFEDHLRTSKLSIEDIQLHRKVADMRHPAEWFPKTRILQRTIHLHVGPTNSGKTYQALKRLEQADTGVYAGPLRLLAHEVYTRMNAKGKLCSLITGDDIRIPQDGTTTPLRSCTVEMVPLDDSTIFDVAVIDEIQLMADDRRGWAWTQAVLGIQAKEVHLCGESRAVPLIRELAASMGDRLEIHNYERLNPLKVMSKSLNGKLKNLRKGDCVVMFSRRKLHSLKREIELITGKRCAIVYGSLPPETRAQQAELFNAPDNEYDYLVASDAIGMGLNLNIKRIVFETSFKFNNDGVYGRLSIAMVKQIAGRAGRYRTATQDVRDSQTTPSTGRETAISSPPEDIALAASLEELDSHVVKSVRGNYALDTPEMTTLSVPENLGLVTTLHEADLPFIQGSMKADPPKLDTAGIHPPAEIIKRFAAFFAPSTPFRFILRRLFNSASTNNRNFIASDREQLEIADVIEDIGPLSVVDRYIIAMCPVNPREDSGRNVMRAFAKCIARRSGGGFLDIPEINLEILDKPLSGDKDYLEELEMLHRAISLYCWLSFRFRAVFVNQPMAIHAKDLVEGQIERALNEFSANRKVRERLLFQSRRMKEEWLEAAKREEAMLQKGRNLKVAEADDLIVNTEKEISEEESARELTETSWEAATEEDRISDDTEPPGEALGKVIVEETEPLQAAPSIGEDVKAPQDKDDGLPPGGNERDEGSAVASSHG